MRPGDPELRIFEDVEELARAAAEEFQGRASWKRGGDDRFTVALSGGSTPRRLHGLLASEPYRDRIPWKRVHLFWGDKRAVPRGGTIPAHHSGESMRGAASPQANGLEVRRTRWLRKCRRAAAA